MSEDRRRERRKKRRKREKERLKRIEVEKTLGRIKGSGWRSMKYKIRSRVYLQFFRYLLLLLCIGINQGSCL